MVISPLVRGLFGIEWDAARKNLRVNPQLPADWDHAKLRNVRIGDLSVAVDIERIGAALRIQATTETPQSLCLAATPLSNKSCAAAPAKVRTIVLPLPTVELSIPAHLPEPGDVTRQLKALATKWGEHSASFAFEAEGGSVYDLPVRLNRPSISVNGGEIKGNKLRVQFPGAQGFVKKTISFQW
jgi:hypothetical protein